jgi:chitodextrinase
MKFRVYSHILMIFGLMGFVSCVGTIEDKNPITTKPAEIRRQSIPFNGLTRAIPISNSRVELYFLPAPGTPDALTYLIYINNAITPVEVNGSSLEINPIGEYRYTVTGLFTNTSYQFRVGVRDAANGTQSDNDKSLIARTFANVTATFNGVSSALPAAGLDGLSSIMVNWIPAVTTSSSIFSPRITDPIGYEIKYMPTSAGNILSLNDPTNPNVVTQVRPTTIDQSTNGSAERSRLITGLLPETSYYFQVRAIHKSWGTFKNDPSYQFEKNTRIVVGTTRGAGEEYSFDRNSFYRRARNRSEWINSCRLQVGTSRGGLMCTIVCTFNKQKVQVLLKLIFLILLILLIKMLLIF